MLLLDRGRGYQHDDDRMGGSRSRSRSQSPTTHADRDSRPFDQRSRSYQTPASTTTPSQGLRIKAPDPPMFEGDRTEFDAWVSSAKQKLRAEGYDSAIANPQEENTVIVYVASRTKGTAFDRLKPRHPDYSTVHPFTYVDRVFEALTRHYGERNRAQKARAAYDELKMKDNESFDDFLARWEACILVFNRSAADQIHELKTKLNRQYFLEVNRQQYDSINQLIDRCHQITYQFNENDRLVLIVYSCTTEQ